MGLMSAKNRRQTMAKITRERALKERREQKQEKKDAARLAKANERVEAGTPPEDDQE
jgi:hypothetical protein